jgi:plastocyanin
VGHLFRTRWIVLGAIVAIALVEPGAVPLPHAFNMASSAQAQNSAAVTISNFAFQPDSLQIAAGTAVTWTNSDGTAHTVTSDDGTFDSGSLAPGASYTQMFTTPGTYTYHCQIHPFMTATIIVS